MIKEVRSYEVSIWTLQDSFITVLKPSNLENKGEIQEPQMSLKDDGENSLSFKIPMYVRDDNDNFIENHIWYTTRNGNIIANLRKIKVIFNKCTEDEEVHEFLITKVEEAHEGFKKYCSIVCEGLAFHELGKQGYRITLEGSDEMAIVQEEWAKTNEGSRGALPEGRINYWADKVLKGSNWNYSVRMDWSAYDGVINFKDNNSNLSDEIYDKMTPEQRNTFNGLRHAAGLRRRDTIYEDSYVSSWKMEDDKLVPSSIESEREMFRMVEAKESNRYNLLQTIAEAFQVFCKFVYTYDDNYHIIGREVIFYNNFLYEAEGIVDLTYKYNTQHLTRQMDSSDSITKMFVSSLSDSDMVVGEVSITDTDANKSLEDYIFNFDYLYNTGAISQEQYDEVEVFEKKMHDLNTQLIKKNNQLNIKENKVIKQKAKLKSTQDSIVQDEEQMTSASALAASLDQKYGGKDGLITYSENNPKMLVIFNSTDDARWKANLDKTEGVKKETIDLYWSYNMTDHKLGDQLPKNVFTVEDDPITGFAKRIILIGGIVKPTENNIIYALYSYDPYLYCKKLAEELSNKLKKDKNLEGALNQEIMQLEAGINILKNEIDILLKTKQDTIDAFERLLGPALREGTWKPEDEYSGYCELKDVNLTLTNTTNTSAFTNELTSIDWDEEPFDNEQEFSYKYGINFEDRYYPCIELTSNILNTYTKDEITNKLTFIYETTYKGDNENTWVYNEYATINSRMFYCFIKKENRVVVPALLLTFADKVSDIELEKMQNGYLGIVNFNNGQVEITSDVREFSWIVAPTKTSMTADHKEKIVYPRIQIDSMSLKNPDTTLVLKQNGELLENYEHYQIMTREDKYYVTLKSEKVILDYKNYFDNNNIPYEIIYMISSAAQAIYLDAIEVLKENAFPKVSYQIDVMALDDTFIKNAYSRLGQIAHINDYEFKFENTMGYISELNLDLDKPWQDKIVIKNYKTKFEDLFSSIVASSEQMKKNAYLFGMVSNAFNADGTIVEEALGNVKNEIQQNIINQIHIPTTEEAYADYEPFIKSKLQAAYTEAGEVLAAAQKSVTDVNKLNIRNGEILASFVTNIRDNLTPTNFIDDKNGNRFNKDLGQPQPDFKVGDIWTRKEDVYMATENSHQIYPNGYPTDILTSTKGWSLLKDGSLAQIKGASLDINTQAGKIQLLAANEIDIKTGGSLNLAGENVQITGDKQVRIGGPDVFIYSGSIDGSDNPERGIHIYASKLDPDTSSETGASAVDVTGNGIVVAATHGIKMESGKSITFSTSDNKVTNAVDISGDRGIWLGSSQAITLYAGPPNSSGEGASVRLNKDEILFGVSSLSTGTAVRMTEDYFVIGVADIVTGDDPTNVGGDEGTAGVLIKKGSIELATGEKGSDYRNYISMNDNGIKIANASNEGNGALVEVNKNGVYIGVKGPTAIKELIDKIKKNEDVTSYKGATFQLYAPNFIVDASGQIYARNAYISGTIYAENGNISGWDINSYSISKAIESNDLNPWRPEAEDNHWFFSGFSIPSKNKGSRNEVALTIGGWTSEDWTAGAFYVTHSGVLHAKGAIISGEITATSLYIGDKTIKDYTDGRINDNTNVQEGISKAKVFTGTTDPKPPYKIGDIWVQGSTGDIKYCNTPKSAGSYYDAKDWSLAGKYTDSKATITSDDTPPSNPKEGDLFIASGNDSNYPAGRTYRYTGNQWIAISAGVIAGTSLSVDTDSGNINITANNTIDIESDKRLNLFTNGKLAISGAGGVEIGSGGNITISSGGTFNVSSGNFSITSAKYFDALDRWFFTGFAGPTNTNNPSNDVALTIGGWTSGDWTAGSFYVKHNGEMHATSAVISGNITATSGYIGSVNAGWFIHEDSITSTKYYDSLGRWYFNGFASVSNADNPNSVALTIGGNDSNNWASAPFYVTHGGSMHSTSGTIGEWAINNYSISSLKYLDSEERYYFTSFNNVAPGEDIHEGAALEIGGKSPYLPPHSKEYPPFCVLYDGSLIATKATISGNITTTNITATGGEIGNFTIGKLYSDDEENTSYFYTKLQATEEKPDGTMDSYWLYSGMNGNSIESHSTPIFFAGARIENDNFTSANFSVQSNGLLKTTNLFVNCGTDPNLYKEISLRTGTSFDYAMHAFSLLQSGDIGLDESIVRNHYIAIGNTNLPGIEDNNFSYQTIALRAGKSAITLLEKGYTESGKKDSANSHIYLRTTNTVIDTEHLILKISKGSGRENDQCRFVITSRRPGIKNENIEQDTNGIVWIKTSPGDPPSDLGWQEIKIYYQKYPNE